MPTSDHHLGDPEDIACDEKPHNDSGLIDSHMDSFSGHPCSQREIFDEITSELHSPKELQCPVFIELCAGSAKLSAAVKRLGYLAVAVDHDKNRHQPRCKLVQLDLSQKQSWETLKYLIQHAKIAGVHMGPPCGTCSRARGIPLADGSPGPQPLRSAQHPLGLPSLSYSDRQRVDIANSIYKLCAEFIMLLDEHNIPWTVENPTDSMMWELEFFTWALAHGHFINMHACAFGGDRMKLTTFLCSENAFHKMSRFCDGTHEHLPWGTADDGTFNTALEAEYPAEMCKDRRAHV